MNLVERLRNKAGAGMYKYSDDLMAEAADRIKSLEAALKEARKQADWNKRIRNSVDSLLEQGGYHEESSSRHQLNCMNFDCINSINSILGEQ